MKFISKYILLFAAAMMLFMPACDNGFQEINTNPGAAAEINPAFQFSNVQLRTSGGRYENWRAGLIYSSMMVQHMSALCGYWTGDKYTYNAGYSSSLWDVAYPDQIKHIQVLINDLESLGKGDEGMLGMAKIWRVVIFHRLTDMYGDLPYSEAGKGFLEGIDSPAYDSQESIYKDMLNELETGVAMLNSGGFGSADFIYGGDLDKWKRFGNSLMLRLAMRLSEVDPGTAQTFVGKALGGPLMQEDAAMTHTNGPAGINRNGIGEVLDKSNGFGDDCPRISATFMDWMQGANDPRIPVIAELPDDGSGVYNGLPNGLDATLIIDNPTGASVDNFSRVNKLLVSVSSPMMFMTVAETEFLQAEAAVRGWGSGNATDHYNAGVKAAMQQYGAYDASLAIDDAAVDAYLAANPFDSSLRMIGWQYWAATFLNEYESFSNWRRTGFPELVATNHPTSVTSGTVPVRLVYPQSEVGINTENFNAALSRQGLSADFASNFSVPVWWDK